MSFDKSDAVGRARRDLARRLGVSETDVSEEGVERAEFPDMALGAPVGGEMSGMMITPGWRIRLRAGGRSYEYRADDQQLRLYKFKGTNYKV
jgi:hypothetical protein